MIIISAKNAQESNSCAFILLSLLKESILVKSITKGNYLLIGITGGLTLVRTFVRGTSITQIVDGKQFSHPGCLIR